MPANNWKPGRQRRQQRSPWETDNVQFPRLLAEINAMGLTAPQYSMLESSMDLTTEQVDELLERAEKRWNEIKNRTKLNP
jgi:hypothetical protein